MSRLKNKESIFFIVLITVVCAISLWLTAKANASGKERGRFLEYYKSKKAYYMARSGFEHLLLKLNAASKQKPAAVSAIKNAKNKEQKKIICSAFIQDIIVPPGEKVKSERQRYFVSACDILPLGNVGSGVALSVTIEGGFADKSDSLSRLVVVK